MPSFGDNERKLPPRRLRPAWLRGPPAMPIRAALAAWAAARLACALRLPLAAAPSGLGARLRGGSGRRTRDFRYLSVPSFTISMKAPAAAVGATF